MEPAVRKPRNIYSARILIVDDCCDTGGVLCELLTWMGYESVSSTTDGKALVNMDAATTYSLMLLDMHMPILDGLEILRRLQNTQTIYSMPVIAISGDQRYRAAAMAAGAYAFLLKPFNQGELETTVHGALSNFYESLT